MKRLMGKSFYNMYQYPEFAKAAIILIDGTDKALDYQAAIFVIALETLCTKLKMIYDRIIKDIGLWTKIRKHVTKSFVEARERYNVDEAFIEMELQCKEVTH